MLPLKPGEWYISVVCEHCQYRILLFYDLSQGKSKLRQTKLHIICPRCQKEGAYQPEHYQTPNGNQED